MKVKYDNGTIYLTDSKNLNIAQSFDPETEKSFIDEAVAANWLAKFIAKEKKASIIYFNLDILDSNNNIINSNEVQQEELYTLRLTESTKTLTGAYEITLKSDHLELQKHMLFEDGIAEKKIMFNYANSYEVILDNDFYIGQEKFITLISSGHQDTNIFRCADNEQYLIKVN